MILVGRSLTGTLPKPDWIARGYLVGRLIWSIVATTGARAYPLTIANMLQASFITNGGVYRVTWTTDKSFKIENLKKIARVHWGIRYPDGWIAYDMPEQIPQYVRNAIARMYATA